MTQAQPAKAAAAPAAKAIAPIEAFRLDLVKMKKELEPMLPSHIPVDKFLRVLQTAAQLRPEIVTANRSALWGEVMKCAQDGLVPDGREATINCYRKKDGTPSTPKYIPMVGGICKKARNSGEIKDIDAIVVYEKDEYKSWVDETGRHFRYEKARTNPGSPILTFAYARTTNGGFYFEEISEEQMGKIEAASRAKEDSPWKGPFKDEMRRKSALRRLSKYRLPSSADLDQVMSRDNDLFIAPPAKPEDAAIPKETSSRLSTIVQKATASQAAPEPEPKAAAPAKMDAVDAEVVEAIDPEEVPI